MTLSPEKNPSPLFPENLLDGDPSSQKGRLCWRIAHVKSRREKALAGYLADHGIGYFLPMVQRRQPAAKRVRYSLLPLFPGYLFFKADDSGRYTALRSNQIARVIDVSDPVTLVQELRGIHQALCSGLPVLPADFLQPGRRVRVTKGPLKDVEGVVIRRDKHFRLVLSVSSIMQSVSVELDSDMVEPV
ncbi:MAG: hypothetical protein KFF46_08575 [Desulfobacterales bacterium]|nr:hypothetical protein [Desulfobacterales bacterium]